MNAAVFLDRDGVINRPVIRDGRTFPPQTLADFVYLDGVPEAIAALKAAGYIIVVVTNQPDISTGKQTRAVVEAMHSKLRCDLRVDDIRMCIHIDSDACVCRKPMPGMLLEAARDHNIDLSASFMVGDRWRDIEAGNAAGCRNVFIDYDLSEKRPEATVATVASLSEAVPLILSGLVDVSLPQPHDGDVILAATEHVAGN